jgi:hypothetical protein
VHCCFVCNAQQTSVEPNNTDPSEHMGVGPLLASGDSVWSGESVWPGDFVWGWELVVVPTPMCTYVHRFG